MRGVVGVLSKLGALGLLFGGTVSAVDKVRAKDSFFTVVVDNSLDQRVDAYVEPIKITKAKLRGHENDPIVLRELSEMWITLQKHGKLAQIHPGYFGESLIEGPKGTIYSTCLNISNKLSESAEQRIKSGDKDAMLDVVRSIEMINIVRFGSPETLFTSTAFLRRPTKLLKENWDKLSPSVIARLEQTQDPALRKKKTDQMEQVINRQRTQYTVRYGQAKTIEDDPTYSAFVGKTGQKIAAEHFYGFDREIGSAPNKSSR